MSPHPTRIHARDENHAHSSRCTHWWHPRSQAVRGRIFDIIKTLRPSARGQLEIVDATNAYIAMNEHDFRLVHGFWSDAGTFESLMQSSRWAEKRASPKRPKKKIDLLIK